MSEQTEWIEIPETLLHQALRESDPLTRLLEIRPIKYMTELRDHKDLTDVPRTLIEAIIEYLSEDLGCDHSVGICMCSTIAVVNELNLLLDGKMTCPTCHGEGFTFDYDALEAACVTYAEKHGGTVKEARDYIGDDPGYIKCPHCEGRSVVPIEKAASR